MIYSVNLLAVLVPLILLQYGLSLFCLVRLVFLDLPKKKFIIWNFFILIVVGIGVITFFVCYFKFRDKVFPKRQPEENSSTDDPAASSSEINENEPAETGSNIKKDETPENS